MPRARLTFEFLERDREETSSEPRTQRVFERSKRPCASVLAFGRLLRSKPRCVRGSEKRCAENHFRINHTSATWQPRPLPPRPGSCVQLKFSEPPRVASAGMSNSIGLTGVALRMNG